MAVTFVGAAQNAVLNSAPTIGITCPTVQDNDYAVALFGHGSGNITPPPGFTLYNSITVGALLAKLYVKFLTAADSGDTLTWANDGTQQRIGVQMGVYRGTSGIGVLATRSETTSIETHPMPNATSPAGGCSVISFVMERSSTPSTAFTQPSGYVLRGGAFGAGNGAQTVSLADRLANVAAGGSIGGGDWVGTAPVQNVATYTIGLVPSTTVPVTGTFTIAPASGSAPLSVVGTVSGLSGGAGAPYDIEYHWGDGDVTGPTQALTATHTYQTAAAYTAALNNRAYILVD